jgi:hypothetical protein
VIFVTILEKIEKFVDEISKKRREKISVYFVGVLVKKEIKFRLKNN